MDELQLLTVKQAAQLLRVEPHTLTVWRCRKPEKSPPYVRIGRYVYYRRVDLNEWIAASVVRPGCKFAARP